MAHALASFIGFEFRSTDSRFDAYLRGRRDALDPLERRGLGLFYGAAGCSACHAAPFQTDHGFHSIALPQFGPGKDPGKPVGAASKTSGYADPGRALVTGDPAQAYRFRTPSLRNVSRTAPYGHNGAYGTLEGILRHHLDPVGGLRNYDRRQARLHPLDTRRDDWQVMDDPAEVARIAASSDLAPQRRAEADIAALLAFLEALTDETALAGRLGAPRAVPSGLPLDPSGSPSAPGPLPADAGSRRVTALD